MKLERNISRPVGVGTLVYVGDDGLPPHNRGAMLMCQAGIAMAGAGLLINKKQLRNVGALVAVVGFLTL